MIPHQFITVLVTITLVEMMVAIGLAIPLADVLAAARNGWRLARAVVANYLIVPAAALAVLECLADSQTLATALLIVAVFPGASYIPPFTTFAKGDVSLSVGLMVLLAASSAIVGPALLQLLLHLTHANTRLTVDVPRVIGMLALIQLTPLAAGMLVRQFAPGAAVRLRGPAELLGKVLNGCAIGGILYNHFQEPGPSFHAGIPAMIVLLLASLAAGYALGGPGKESRKTVALTTSLRNIGVSVVVASSHEVGPAALAAVVGYAIIEVSASFVLALWWGRGRTERASPNPVVGGRASSPGHLT